MLRKELIVLVLFVTTGAVAGHATSADFVDANSQALGMHICRAFAPMRGVDAENNLFVCLSGIALNGTPSVDSSTQAQINYNGGSHSVHVCPAGSFMVGWNQGANQLACLKQANVAFVGSSFADTSSQEPEPGQQSQTIHVCAGGNQPSVMVGIEANDNVFVCQNIGAVTHPPAQIDFEDDETQFDLMHNCPLGSAMRGIDANNNRFFCQFTGSLNETAIEDDRTQQSFLASGSQQQVHVCPNGFYMRGWDKNGNRLTCSPFGAVLPVGTRFPDPGSQEVEQGHGNLSMHVCQGAGTPSYMVGVDNATNTLICQKINLPANAGSPPQNHFVSWVTLPGGVFGSIIPDPSQFTMNNATYVNVYFGPGWSSNNNLKLIRLQIDAALGALGNTNYLKLLLEYGLNPPRMVGSVLATAQCEQDFKPTPSKPYAPNGTELTSGTFSDLAGCMERSGALPSHQFINVFVDPSTHPDEWPTEQPCGNTAPGAKDFDGYHNFTNGNLTTGDVLKGYYFTVIPMSSDCLSMPFSGATPVASVLSAVSHEIVETVSDPLSTRGWIHPIGPVRLNGQEGDHGELGDICESEGFVPDGFSTNGLTFVQATLANSKVALARYWSNYEGTCIPSIVK